MAVATAASKSTIKHGMKLLLVERSGIIDNYGHAEINYKTRNKT